MSSQRFEPVERIELDQAEGDVAIQGWDEQAIELTVDGDESQCTVEVQDQTLHVSCRAPLSLQVSRSTIVQVGEVSGDLLLSGLDGAVSVKAVRGDAFVGKGNASVSLDEVQGDLGVEDLNGSLEAANTHGDLHLSHVSAVRLGSVHGDLYVRDVAADLEIGSVSGDVRLREVAGQVTLEEGRGDLRGRDLAGGLTVHQVHGDLSLKTDLASGQTYRARAQGDVSARFPPETSARFTLQAQGDLSTQGLEAEQREVGRFVGRAGAGEAEVVLEAGGSLSVKVRGDDEEPSWGFSLEGLGAKIEAEIAAELSEHMDVWDHGQMVAREIEKAMRQVEGEIEKAQRQAERSAERAQERARRAEERARQAQERAREQARKLRTRVERRWGPPVGSTTQARRSRTAPRGPSAEERMVVLGMLQAGKISAEEAETLLKALGD